MSLLKWFIALLFLGSPTVVAAPMPPVPQPTHAQEVYMNALEWCESNGSTTVKVIDSDGYYSYGALQFHMNTFLMYAEKYGIPATTTDIYNEQLQKRVAWQMLEHGLQSQWTCARKVGMYPKKKIPEGI